MTAEAPRPTLDPAVTELLGSIGARWTALTDLQDAPTGTGGVDDWVDVAAGEYGTTRVRVVRPSHVAGPLPGVLYLHGGGWMAGDSRTHARIVAHLAAGTPAAVVLPEFASTPAARHPVALEQAYATVRWVLVAGARHGIDARRIALAGDSTGAALAIGLVLLSLWRNEFRFAQLVAFTPVLDPALDTESATEFAEGYLLRRDDLARYWDDHLGVGDRSDPTVSALHASASDLANFPPALIITAEADVARDEGEAFAARLRHVGVATTAVRYEGTIHGFPVLDALARSSAARAATAQAVAALTTALHGIRT